MKNIYIIAQRQGYEPVLIKQKIFEDVTYIGKYYKHAYIFPTMENAKRCWKERYEQWKERKDDENYPEYF